MRRVNWRKKYPHLAAKHRERERERAREYYWENREKTLQRLKIPENREKKRVYFKEWKKNNAELYDSYIKKWKNSPSGIYSGMCKGAHLRKIEMLISRREFMEWYDMTEKKCVYCGVKWGDLKSLPREYARRSGRSRLSIDRKDSFGPYSLENIVMACYMCNTIKNNLLTFDEMVLVGDVVLREKVATMIEDGQ